MIISKTAIDGPRGHRSRTAIRPSRLLRPHLLRRRVQRGRSDRLGRTVQPVLQPSGRHAARNALPGLPAPGGQAGPLHRRRDRRHHRRPSSRLTDPVRARCGRAQCREPARALRAALLRPRVPNPRRRRRGALPGQRLVRAGGRARPALATIRVSAWTGRCPSPWSARRTPAGSCLPSAITDCWTACPSRRELRDDHRRLRAGRPRGGGPADPGGPGRRRLHGPRPDQPDRQLHPWHAAGGNRQPHPRQGRTRLPRGRRGHAPAGRPGPRRRRRDQRRRARRSPRTTGRSSRPTRSTSSWKPRVRSSTAATWSLPPSTTASTSCCSTPRWTARSARS